MLSNPVAKGIEYYPSGRVASTFNSAAVAILMPLSGNVISLLAKLVALTAK